MKIANKLIVLLLLIALIPIVIVGIMAYNSGRQALKKQIAESFTAIAESKESELTLYLRGKTGRVLDLSTDVVIRDSLEKISQKGPDVNEATEKLNRYLSEEKKPLDPEVYEMFVIDLQGKVVSSTYKSEIGQEKSSDPYFVQGKKGVYIKDIYESKTTGKIGFAVSAPLLKRTTKELMGVVVNRYEVTGLNAITTNREGLRETGEVYIVNKDGYMITESRFQKDVVLKQRVDTEPVRLFQGQKKVMTGIYRDYRNQPVLGASMGDDIDKELGLGWTILTEIDTAEAFAPITALGIQILVITIVIILVVVVMAIIVARGITNPVRTLKVAATEIGKGKLGFQIKVNTKDELADLASSFNKMSSDLQNNQEEIQVQNEELNTSNEELKSSNEEIVTTNEELRAATEELRQANEELKGLKEGLEKKVEERTAELEPAKRALEKKVADLERFNKLSVGRELAMKEMKARLAELEEKLREKS